MKKHFIAFNIVLIPVMMLSASMAWCQHHNSSPEARAQKLTDWMKTNLMLTADQVPKVQEINLKYAVKNEELRNSPSPRSQKLKTLNANDLSKDDELEQILTDEQFEAYQEKKVEVKEKLKEEAKARKKG